MKPLSTTKANVKTMISLLVLCALIISAVAAPANAYDYRAKFLQEAQWLTTQQAGKRRNTGRRRLYNRCRNRQHTRSNMDMVTLRRINRGLYHLSNKNK